MKFKTPKREMTVLNSFEKLNHFDFENITVQDICDFEGKVKWKDLFPEFIILFGMLKEQLLSEGFHTEAFNSWECPMWGEGEKSSTLLCFESKHGNIDVWIELIENEWVMTLSALDEEFCEVEEDFKTIQETMEAYKAYG
ncbi:hypothetical protein VNN41_09995 [Lactococcus garvieae]|uniref:hypothetical protein n=1 Tax=Lactococcus garvieae TaxID=1363 RepID=UPI00325346AE